MKTAGPVSTVNSSFVLFPWHCLFAVPDDKSRAHFLVYVFIFSIFDRVFRKHSYILFIFLYVWLFILSGPP